LWPEEEFAMAERAKKRVAVLGATGAVGQRFVQLLAVHPWFEISALGASEKSAGRLYGEATRWLLPGGVPERAASMAVASPDPEAVRADLVFSALDADAASRLEPAFRDGGAVVVSNASSFRQDPEVPLVIPEVNPGHLEAVTDQRKKYGGAIVTNPNCSTIGLCLALDPLRKAFGLESVSVTTMQALSGAGYPGVASLDALDNVLPEIKGEEEKVEREPRKIFGTRADGVFVQAALRVSAQCNRVPVRDGHTLSVSVKLGREAGLEEVRRAYRDFRSPLEGLGLPSAPNHPVILEEAPCRPQPLLDRDASGGMAVTVGRLCGCPVLGYRFVALVHNTIRGAAGGTILIAEYMLAKGLV
jgi:aspartate-semialdehyde dehydrogenase